MIVSIVSGIALLSVAAASLPSNYLIHVSGPKDGCCSRLSKASLSLPDCFGLDGESVYQALQKAISTEFYSVPVVINAEWLRKMSRLHLILLYQKAIYDSGHFSVLARSDSNCFVYFFENKDKCLVNLLPPSLNNCDTTNDILLPNFKHALNLQFRADILRFQKMTAKLSKMACFTISLPTQPRQYITLDSAMLKVDFSIACLINELGLRLSEIDSTIIEVKGKIDTFLRELYFYRTLTKASSFFKISLFILHTCNEASRARQEEAIKGSNCVAVREFEEICTPFYRDSSSVEQSEPEFHFALTEILPKNGDASSELNETDLEQQSLKPSGAPNELQLQENVSSASVEVAVCQLNLVMPCDRDCIEQEVQENIVTISTPQAEDQPHNLEASFENTCQEENLAETNLMTEIDEAEQNCSPIDSTTAFHSLIEFTYSERALEPTEIFALRKKCLDDCISEGQKISLLISRAKISVPLLRRFNFRPCTEKEIQDFTESEMKQLLSDMKISTVALMSIYDEWALTNPADAAYLDEQMKIDQKIAEYYIPNALEKDNDLLYSENGMEMEDIKEKRQIWLDRYFNQGKRLERWLEDSGENCTYDYFPYIRCYISDVESLSEEKMKSMLRKMKRDVDRLESRIQELIEGLKRKCFKISHQKEVEIFLSNAEQFNGSSLPSVSYYIAAKALKCYEILNSQE